MKIRTKYYCEYCSKEFGTEASYQTHKEAHAIELTIINKHYVNYQEFPDIIRIISPTKENLIAIYKLDEIKNIK